MSNEIREEVTQKEIDETVNTQEPTQTEETPVDAPAIEKGVAEAQAEQKKNAESEFISEFAPEPIKIPKYNKEKEMKKIKKANEKKKKRNSKKSRRRRKLLRKIVFTIRTVFLFIVLFAVLTVTLATLLVKMNTSEYAVKSAVRTGNPETFVIGKIKDPAKLNIKESSSRAAMTDILRDNSMLLVTYADIEREISKSSYPDFIADAAHGVINYYVYGTPVKKITETQISDVILENVSSIKLLTGTELGESACKNFGSYIVNSKAVKEIAPERLKAQKATSFTPATSVLFSMPALICMIVALILLLVITIICCSKFAHKIMGWVVILSGVSVGVLGFLFKPLFSASSEFVTCVMNAIVKSFNQSSIIFGAIVAAVGVLILLIGRAISDDDEDEEDEEDYIDEIEQVSTAG